jgi:hypothetical protein
MNDRDDVKQPLDHLPPKEERDPGSEPEEPSYPDTGEPAHESAVSPETAAAPGEGGEHDFDTRPPS